MRKSISHFQIIANSNQLKKEIKRINQELEHISEIKAKKLHRASTTLSKFISQKIAQQNSNLSNMITINNSVIKPLNISNIPLNFFSSRYIKTNSPLSSLNLNPINDIKKDEYYNRIKFLSNDKEATSTKITPHLEEDIVEIEGKIYRSKLSIQNITNDIHSPLSTRELILFNKSNNKSKEGDKENRNSYTNHWIKEPSKIKAKTSFKNKDVFTKMIIEHYIEKNNVNAFDNKHRSIFVILDGTVIIDETIKGIFFDIPKRVELKKKLFEEKQILTNQFLSECTRAFLFPRALTYIFNYERKLLLTLEEIKEEDMFIIVSSSFFCSGPQLNAIPNLTNAYIKDFKNYINKNKKNVNDSLEFPITNNKKVFKSKKIFRSKKKIGNYNTFTEGEFEQLDEEYIYYSDKDEKIKKEIKKKISENCFFKYDFFLYLNNKEYSSKINHLIEKNRIKKNFNIEDDYSKFHYDYDKMLNRFNKETMKKIPIIDTSDKYRKKKFTTRLISNINIHNLLHKEDQIHSVFLEKKNKAPFKAKNKKNNVFYPNLDRNVSKYYPYLFFFNIPKFKSLYKNFDRKTLFQLFIVYKNLIALCYGINKSDIILENGIDFKTFWKCVNEISGEKEEFAQKLFYQINKSNSGLLSMKEFFEGMSFIKNTELKEKIDLFLKALDEEGKEKLEYNEVLSICKKAIERNLYKESSNNIKDNTTLEELSNFFAELIFKLLSVNPEKSLHYSDIKKAIINGSVETKYLEMFCNANIINRKKINYLY